MFGLRKVWKYTYNLYCNANKVQNVALLFFGIPKNTKVKLSFKKSLDILTVKERYVFSSLITYCVTVIL